MKFGLRAAPTRSAAPHEPAPSEPGDPLLRELEKDAVLSVTHVLDLLIDRALAERASDIHLDPRAGRIAARFRIDGVLADKYELPARICGELVARLKVLCGLRTDEHQSAQDGRFRSEMSGAPADVRVSIVPTYHGERAVLRLLAAGAEEFTLDALGFAHENARRIAHAAARPHGLILATGPTGSGKTTTLYTLVKLLNKPGISIVTLEDPIEYSIGGVNQIQVNSRAGLSFGNGLRSVLRQDPNVIMVGEIRDAETAALAVNAALAGHLVLSTLHTNDAPTTLPRLLDMGVEPYLVASTVSAAIGQRLVRRICNGCRHARTISAAEADGLGGSVRALAHAGARVCAGAGCTRCNGSGYAGRIAIAEVMVAGDAVREAVLRKASAAEMRAAALQEGMMPMMDDGIAKVRDGLTTIEEVLRACHE